MRAFQIGRTAVTSGRASSQAAIAAASASSRAGDVELGGEALVEVAE